MDSIGYDISSYATMLGNFWGIGVSGRENGVLILLSIKERAINISVGYGLERVLTDKICGEIIRNVIVPNFKKQKYYEGLAETTKKIGQVIKNEYTVDEPCIWFCDSLPGERWMLFIMLIIFPVVFFSFTIIAAIYGWDLRSSSDVFHSIGSSSSSNYSSDSSSSSGYSSDSNTQFQGFRGGQFGGGGASGRW